MVIVRDDHLPNRPTYLTRLTGGGDEWSTVKTYALRFKDEEAAQRAVLTQGARIWSETMATEPAEAGRMSIRFA